MRDYQQAKLTLKKNYVLIKEQRTSPEWGVGNSDIVTQLKVFFLFFSNFQYINN